MMFGRKNKVERIVAKPKFRVISGESGYRVQLFTESFGWKILDGDYPNTEAGKRSAVARAQELDSIFNGTAPVVWESGMNHYEGQL